eukprot:GDKK01040475.1.p1 GENE.GDKK01040475.1~~GDKK01040475.1.p1  ORF type:complete len:565 (-),score=111.76 GDKK01040475.1:268-1725(-)
MSNAVPFIFNVVSNTFKQNAVLVFEGSFPKDSSILIQGNVWAGNTSPHSVYGALAGHAIFFYTTSSQRIDERAKIRIVGNTIPVVMSTVAYAIGINSAINLYANSVLEISGNDLSCTVTAANLFPAVIGWGFTSALSIQGESSSIIISNNKISTGNDALGIYMSAINSGGRAFNLNVTNNIINMNGAANFPLRVKGLSVAGASRVYVSNNTVSSIGSDGRFQITDMALGGSTICQFSYNKVKAYGGNAVISFENAAQVGGSAQFSVEFNDLLRTDDFAAGVPAIQFISSLALSGTSVSSFSYNYMDAIGRPAHYMVYSSSASKAATAKLFLCNNVHYDSVLTAFDVYVTADIRNMMENQTLCLARTTAAPPATTTTATRITTTRAATTAAGPTTSVPVIGGTTASGITAVSGVTTVVDGNVTADANSTTVDNGNETVPATTAAATSTFAPGVTTTEAPLNNQCGSRGGVMALAAACVGSVLATLL